MIVTGSIGSGLLLSKSGYYAPFYIIGSGMTVIASAFLFRTTADTSDGTIYVLSALMGLGSGIYDQVGFSIAQVKVSKEKTGQAIGFLSAGQLIGVVATLTICGTVMLNTAISGLADVLPDVSPDVIESIVAGTAGATFQSLPPDIRTAALNVVVDAINKAYLVTLTVASIGFVCSLLLKHERIFVDEIKTGQKIDT
jgi:MFS family permease